MNFWNDFAAKHPAAAKWVREGGLFVIVSNLITVFKYLLLQFLPKAFASLPVVDFGWPGIDITLFGETFKWNILGYDAAHGGLPYFCAYMVAMVLGEVINFPIQRNFVFRSKGNLAKPKMKEELVRFWLLRFRKLDMSQQEQRQALVDTFVNSIYLYDDKVLITFNYKEGTETVTFGEATEAEKSSDICARGAPTKSKYTFVCLLFFVVCTGGDENSTAPP